MSIQPIKFVNAKEMVLAGIDRYYTFQNMGEIPTQWAEFGPHWPRIPGQIDKVAYGLCHEMIDQGFRYMSCTEVSKILPLPEEFSSLVLPGYRYAVFAHSEHVTKLSDTIDAI